MSRFIVYTEPDGAAEKKRRTVYVNLDHIAKASFDPDDGKLTLFFASDSVAQSDRRNTAILEGQEAADAMQVLRDVV